MQGNIQKQLQDMQNTFLDKFSQLKGKDEQPMHTSQDPFAQNNAVAGQNNFNTAPGSDQ